VCGASRRTAFHGASTSVAGGLSRMICLQRRPRPLAPEGGAFAPFPVTRAMCVCVSDLPVRFSPTHPPSTCSTCPLLCAAAHQSPSRTALPEEVSDELCVARERAIDFCPRVEIRPLAHLRRSTAILFGDAAGGGRASPGTWRAGIGRASTPRRRTKVAVALCLPRCSSPAG
jgi:hypothetical protein